MPGPDLSSLRLIDHHVHGIMTGELSGAQVAALLCESPAPQPPGTDPMDSQLGFAVRRVCAPVLDLEPHAPASEYLSRRADLGSEEVSRRLLTGARVGEWVVDTGHHSDAVTSPAELAELSGTPASQTPRLESLAQQIAAGGSSAAGFGPAVTAAISAAAASAVGFKSIVAYRGGLDFDPARPSAADVASAAGRWLAALEAGAPVRLEDEVLIRHGIWAALDTGLPLQLHTGYGDPDSRLYRANPALLHDFLLATQGSGTPVMLLHTYPYHREAAAMASLFTHVYMDVGVALNYTGARSATVLAEALEITPFHKMLYSSDAFGLPELHYLGAVGFRRDLARVTGEWVDDGAWSAADAARVSELIGWGNAVRVYRLGER